MITYTNVEPEFGVKEKTNPQSLTLSLEYNPLEGDTRGCTSAMPRP